MNHLGIVFLGIHSLQYLRNAICIVLTSIVHFSVFPPNVQSKRLTRIQCIFPPGPPQSVPLSTMPHNPRISCLSLLYARSGFALVALDWVHHDLVRVLWCIACITLAPIVADSIRKDLSIAAEGCSCDCSASSRVSL